MYQKTNLPILTHTVTTISAVIGQWNYHSLAVTDLSVRLSVWCPQPQTAVLTWPLRSAEKTLRLGSHSSSHTDTDTQAEEGNSVRVCVCLWSVKQFSLSSSKAPWGRQSRGERMGGGRANGMLSHLPWVGSRSLQAWWGAEEIKPLAFVVGLRITEEERGAVPYIRISQPVCVWGYLFWEEWGHPLYRLKRYHLPNLRLTLINLCLCNSNLQRHFLLTSEACIATDVAFPVWLGSLNLRENGGKSSPFPTVHYLSHNTPQHERKWLTFWLLSFIAQ